MTMQLKSEHKTEKTQFAMSLTFLKGGFKSWPFLKDFCSRWKTVKNVPTIHIVKFAFFHNILCVYLTKSYLAYWLICISLIALCYLLKTHREASTGWLNSLLLRKFLLFSSLFDISKAFDQSFISIVFSF